MFTTTATAYSSLQVKCLCKDQQSIFIYIVINPFLQIPGAFYSARLFLKYVPAA